MSESANDGEEEAWMMDRDDNDAEPESDVIRLMRYWMDERCSPQVLRWQGDLVDDLMYKLEQQVRRARAHL